MESYIFWMTVVRWKNSVWILGQFLNLLLVPHLHHLQDLGWWSQLSRFTTWTNFLDRTLVLTHCTSLWGGRYYQKISLFTTCHMAFLMLLDLVMSSCSVSSIHVYITLLDNHFCTYKHSPFLCTLHIYRMVCSPYIHINTFYPACVSNK